MRTLLIVEDEENLLQLHRMEFENMNYRVKTASDCEEAERIFSESVVDLIIVDIQLPGKNGLNLIEDFLQKRRETPVIIYSAYSQYKDDYKSWLADAYIVKSGDRTELHKKVRELLD